MEEIEVKFLNVDAEKLQEKLKAIGAEKTGEYFYRRQVFDFPGFTLNEKGAWLRLRDEGDRIALSYKQRLGIKSHDGTVSDEGMKEVEVVVSDFDKTKDLLLSLGMIEKFYQENKRIRYKKGTTEFDIDFWPQLEPYLEIEAESWDKVDESIKELGLNPKDKKIFSTNQIYKLKGINELDYTRITFDGFVKRSQ